jgi:hypothetical protein
MRGEIKPMARLMLKHMHLDPGGPWEDEVTRAMLQAGLWGHEFFDHREAATWLDQCPGIDARTAAQFRGVGIPPNVAAQRSWYGKANPERPCLYQRVAMCDITIDEAVEQLRQARLI